MVIQAFFSVRIRPTPGCGSGSRGSPAGQPFVRRSELRSGRVGGGGPCLGLPAGGLDSARLRFELLTPGTLWMDDLRVAGEPLGDRAAQRPRPAGGPARLPREALRRLRPAGGLALGPASQHVAAAGRRDRREPAPPAPHDPDRRHDCPTARSPPSVRSAGPGSIPPPAGAFPMSRDADVGAREAPRAVTSGEERRGRCSSRAARSASRRSRWSRPCAHRRAGIRQDRAGDRRGGPAPAALGGRREPRGGRCIGSATGRA